MNKLKHEDIMPGMRFKHKTNKNRSVWEVLYIENYNKRYSMVCEEGNENETDIFQFLLEHLNEMTYLGPSIDPIPQRGWVEFISKNTPDGLRTLFFDGSKYKFFGLSESGEFLVLNSMGRTVPMPSKYFKILDPTEEGDDSGK